MQKLMILPRTEIESSEIHVLQFVLLDFTRISLAQGSFRDTKVAGKYHRRCQQTLATTKNGGRTASNIPYCALISSPDTCTCDMYKHSRVR